MADTRNKLTKTASSVTLWFAINVLFLTAFLCIEFSSLSKPLWWKEGSSIAVSILTGGLVSFFFYWLVVYNPEQRKRRIIKSNFSKMYKNIRKDILYLIIFASQKGGRHDLQADRDTIAKLMTIQGFKDAFSGGREADEGFYAFMNQMSDNTQEFREIVQNLEILSKQIEFVLHNYTIEDESLFDFFKRLEMMLLSLRRSTPGYDESKRLCQFLYEIFAGFNVIDGYRDFDVIEKMIADI